MRQNRQEYQKYKEHNDSKMEKSIKEELLTDMEARREAEENCRRRNENMPGRDWDREEFLEYRRKNDLRDELFRELQAVQDIENRLGRMRNPETRRLVRELLEEARRKGMTTADLVQSMAGSRRTVRERLSALLFDPHNRFPLGVGAALLGLLLIPSARESVRPLARKAIEGVMNLSEKTQTVIAKAQEDLSDIVAEAQFSRIANSVQQSVDNHEPNE